MNLKSILPTNPFLRVILLVYVLFATLYSVITPIWEASDEQWHYPFIKYIADQRALPVQQATTPTAWRQEGSQPPLYYVLGALLTGWIDTSDMDQVRQLNPHADIGVLVPDSNYNMAIHDVARENFPWRGTVLAIHLVRLLSVALGAITVLMTWYLARELFPAAPTYVWHAAAIFTAFIPMFTFISGSVNNDNLSNALGSLLLVEVVRLLKRTTVPHWPTFAYIGVLTGAGLLAKFNLGFFVPIIALSLAILSWRTRDWRPIVLGGLLTGGLTVLIAGWWYVRNQQLYGDLTGLNMMLNITGRRPIPANWPQLWSERHTFMMSWWGFFGGVNLPFPTWVYDLFNGWTLLAGLGLLVGAVTVALRPQLRQPDWALWAGRALSVVWLAVLFISLLRWTSETWASQGRLLFAGLPIFSVWLAVGLWRLTRWWHPLLLTLACGWFLLASFSGVLLIDLAYDPTEQLSVNSRLCSPDMPAMLVSLAEPQQPTTVLLRTKAYADHPPTSVQAGQHITFWQYMEMADDAIFTRNWSAFIHLETPDGLIVAQRDVYLGQGLLATLNWQGPRQWCNRFSVALPSTVMAPTVLTAYLGFYDLTSAERLVASRAGQRLADGRVQLFTIQVLPQTSLAVANTIPNPLRVNFDNQAELVGYHISDLTPATGQTVDVTLYWRAQQPISVDYRVFVQILEPNTTNVFAADDAMPAAWTRPTSTWKTGEIIEDRHTLTIPPDAPWGTWQLAVGLYQLRETPNAPNGQQFDRLRVITPDGGMAEDYVYLTRVKLVPPTKSDEEMF